MALPVRDTTLSGRSMSVAACPELVRPDVLDGCAFGVPLVHARRPIEERLHPRADGLLGTRWFAGCVWQIDYRSEEMRVLGSAPDGIADSPHTIPMGFPMDSGGSAGATSRASR